MLGKNTRSKKHKIVSDATGKFTIISRNKILKTTEKQLRHEVSGGVTFSRSPGGVTFSSLAHPELN